jgi:hypothetical protein
VGSCRPGRRGGEGEPRRASRPSRPGDLPGALARPERAGAQAQLQPHDRRPAVPGRRRGFQAARRLRRPSQGQGRLRRVGRTLVRDYRRPQAGHPAHLPDAARQPGPPPLRRGDLAGIDTLAVREWVASLVEGGLSPSRVRNAHQVLSQVLAAAVEGGRLARNPAAGVRLPKRVDREMLFLDAVQVEQLADAIGSHHRVLVYFLAYTGLRFGEVVALKTSAYCGAAARWSSRQPRWAAHWSGDRPSLASAALCGCRFLVELLAEHLAGGSRGPDDLVFTAPLGGPLRERKFLHGQLKPAACRAGLSATLAPTTYGTRPQAYSSVRVPASRRCSVPLATSPR